MVHYLAIEVGKRRGKKIQVRIMVGIRRDLCIATNRVVQVHKEKRCGIGCQSTGILD